MMEDTTDVSRRRLLRLAGTVGTGLLGGTAVAAADPDCTASNRWQASDSLATGGVDTYTYTVAYDRPCETTVWLEGSGTADADLFVTFDGRPPSRSDHDRRSQSQGSTERLLLAGESLRGVDELGIAVTLYSGSGEYTVGVEETGRARSVGDDGPATQSETLSASATTLSFIPGLSENEASGGDDLHSIMPNEKEGFIPLVPFDDIPADGGFYGDEIRSLPDSLSEAVAMEKHVEGIDRTFNHYRLRNSLNVEFSTRDGTTVDLDSDVRVNVNGRGSLGDRYGEYTPGELPLREDGQKRFVVDEFETGLTYTILEEDIYRNIQTSAIEMVDDERYKPVHRMNRYLTVNREEFDRGGRTVEGVRVSTVWGASNSYTHEIASMDDFPVVDDFTPDNPILYTWIELTVLADGTRLVRIPDASVDPKHAGYLGDTKRATNGLKVIFEEGVDSGDGHTAAIDEDTNNVWDRFKEEYDENEYVPYGNDPANYIENYRNDGWSLSDYPVMAFGETPDGAPLDRSQTLSILDRDPLPPFPSVS